MAQSATMDQQALPETIGQEAKLEGNITKVERIPPAIIELRSQRWAAMSLDWRSGCSSIELEDDYACYVL